MSEGRITFEMLNAYVDGELDAAATAEVARAIAGNPTLAREVAALSRLRSRVAESVEAPPISVPAPPSRSGRGTAIAAGFAFALFVAGSVLVFNLDRDGGPEELARAWQMHRGWSIEGAAAQPRSPALLVRYAEAVPGSLCARPLGVPAFPRPRDGGAVSGTAPRVAGRLPRNPRLQDLSLGVPYA